MTLHTLNLAADTAAPTAAQPDKLWYTRCPVPSPLGIAARLGWLAETFAQAGIGIESIIDAKDRSVRESHFDHHLSWSFRQGGSIPPIWARAKGRDTRLVAITWTDEFQALITLPGSGITSAAQLAGLSHQDVTLVDLPIAESVIIAAGEPSLHGLRRRHPYFEEVQALVRGQADAIFVKGAEGIVVANLIGAQVVAEFGNHPDPKIRINNGTPRTLTVDAALADQRPDLVVRLLAVVERAADWAAQHPDETLRFVAREIGTTEEAVLASNGPDVHRHLALSLDAPLVDAIGHFKDFLLEWGFLPADFALESWVDAGPLKALRERSATPPAEAAPLALAA